VAPGLVEEVPFFCQGVGQLADIHDIKGFFEHEQAVSVAEAPDNVVPGEIGVAGADDDLQVGTFVPDAGNGFDAVPAGLHAHVHEGHGVGPAFGQGLEHTFQSLLAGEGGVHLEDGETGAGHGTARRLGAIRTGEIPREHFGEHLMNKGVVVNDERSVGRSGAHNGHLAAGLREGSRGWLESGPGCGSDWPRQWFVRRRFARQTACPIRPMPSNCPWGLRRGCRCRRVWCGGP